MVIKESKYSIGTEDLGGYVESETESTSSAKGKAGADTELEGEISKIENQLSCIWTGGADEETKTVGESEGRKTKGKSSSEGRSVTTTRRPGTSPTPGTACSNKMVEE